MEGTTWRGGFDKLVEFGMSLWVDVTCVHCCIKECFLLEANGVTFCTWQTMFVVA